MRDTGTNYEIKAFRRQTGALTSDVLSFTVNIGWSEDNAREVFNLLDDALPPEFELTLRHTNTKCYFEDLTARANTKPSFKEKGDLPSRA